MTPLSMRVIVGLVIVAFGLALTFENLGWIYVGNVLRYWPFLLILIGVTKLFQDQTRSGRIAGGFLAIVGALFAAEIFFFVRFDFWRWWPLVIVFIGVLIMSKAFRGEDKAAAVIPAPPIPGVPAPAAAATVAYPSTTDQKVSEFAIWSGIQRRVTSPSFKQADLTAIMGGIEFDLRQAGAYQGEAEIEVFALWGGIEIIVPPDWSVSNQVTAIMGAAVDKSTGTQQARSRLVVKGAVIMGGVEIRLTPE